MKVLLIDVNCKQGSTGKIVYDLYTLINKNGNEAAICYGRGNKVVEKNIFKFALDGETYLHALLTRLTGLTGCFSPFSTRRLIRFIKKFKPDVIHIHELHAYFVNIVPVLKYIKKNNIKTVFTHHCEFLYTGKCGYSEECERWQANCGKCPHVKEYPVSLFFDRTRHMLKKKKKYMSAISECIMTAPSKWLSDRMSKSFLGSKEILVVHNGIDTENVFFARESGHLRIKHGLNEEKVVLAVAPDIMSERKGGRTVLELAKKMRNENVKFVLIGVSDLSEEFEQNVIPVARTDDQKQLAEYYSMADCFVICSSHENFPTTCLEAQCCGAPVCGFDVGGVKETLLPQFKDNCVAYSDLDALRDAVMHVLATGADHKLISAEAISKYSKSVMGKKYMDIYERFVGEHAAS